MSAISVREKPGTVIAEFEYQEDGERRNYWRVAHILASTRFALLTYTCELDEAGVEGEIVRRIFDKFELELLP